MIKTLVKKLPIIQKLIVERDKLHSELSALKRKMYVRPGHFYSPIPSIDELREQEDKLFNNIPEDIPGVNLRKKEQLDLVKNFETYYEEMPFQSQKTDNRRYFFENPAYSYSDAIFLYCMIRHAKPNKIIEVGSGYSSCVSLDTNELFFDNEISTTFIEPYPKLFLSLINEEDNKRIKLMPNVLQDISLEEFSALEENDILFIDSTHVSKTGSDVNYIFSKILPALSKGVYIHFHDIFYPFEYPKKWVYENRAWNEIYMLRAFLEYNDTFEIVLFNTFLEYFYTDYFEEHMPLCLKNPGGSIWLRKNN